MSRIPAYDIEENLRRIDMQRTLKFIVVEGSDDVPIYENIIASSTGGEVDFEVIHSGGKPRIRRFLNENPAVRNCIFIIDRDFDIIEYEHDKLVYLERYSIENYYFCEDVLKPVIAMSVKVKLDVVSDIFNINAFIQHCTPILLKLFCAIYYYQKVESKKLAGEGKEVKGWSDTFLCKNDTWEVCPEKAEELIGRLYPEGYNEHEAEAYCRQSYASSGNIIADFPGKMLKVALQRYLKDSVIKLSPKWGSKFSNVDVTCTLLMSNLHRSSDLRNNLSAVYGFLSN